MYNKETNWVKYNRGVNVCVLSSNENTAMAYHYELQCLCISSAQMFRCVYKSMMYKPRWIQVKWLPHSDVCRSYYCVKRTQRHWSMLLNGSHKRNGWECECVRVRWLAAAPIENIINTQHKSVQRQRQRNTDREEKKKHTHAHTTDIHILESHFQ